MVESSCFCVRPTHHQEKSGTVGRGICLKFSPNSEMRSTLIPIVLVDGGFDPNFPPKTAEWVRALYRAGGWVESLVHFTDQELALFFHYQGGVFKPGSWAGHVGDPGEFEDDCRDAATHEPTLTAEVVRTIKGTALRQHQKYKFHADIGAKFVKGRKPGTGSPIRKSVERLLKKCPKMSNFDLWEAVKKTPPKGFAVKENHVGKYIEGPPKYLNMNWERFCNIAAETRNKFKK